MRHFLITAAAMTAFAALLASVPARADVNYGPKQNGDQCWKSAAGYDREGRYGYWSACPQTASVVVPRTNRLHHR
jgi:hypothetical protein